MLTSAIEGYFSPGSFGFNLPQEATESYVALRKLRCYSKPQIPAAAAAAAVLHAKWQELRKLYSSQRTALLWCLETGIPLRKRGL